MSRYVVAIDQGTTGSTVLLLSETLVVVSRGYAEFAQIYPQPGWVEHDPETIWQSVLTALGQALS
ncbi:MAG TPA: FGGY family carbohydrate kinase, partial [Pseudomonadota bacterium]|nr:FGGY family carbohydrate kinase [Pseudomonadota bacterium]